MWKSFKFTYRAPLAAFPHGTGKGVAYFLQPRFVIGTALVLRNLLNIKRAMVNKFFKHFLLFIQNHFQTLIYFAKIKTLPSSHQLLSTIKILNFFNAKLLSDMPCF